MCIRDRRGILMGVGDSHRPCGCPAPTRRAQRARAGAPMGSEGLWCGARYDTAECDPHADGAHVRPDVWRCSTRRRDPPNHAQYARRARGGRARAARKSVAAKGGGIQRNTQIEPLVERAEATQRAWVALLSAWGGSVGYQGARNARIPFLRRRPDLLLQYPVHVGHVPSRAARLTLRRTRTHSSPLCRL